MIQTLRTISCILPLVTIVAGKALAHGGGHAPPTPPPPVHHPPSGPPAPVHPGNPGSPNTPPVGGGPKSPPPGPTSPTAPRNGPVTPANPAGGPTSPTAPGASPLTPGMDSGPNFESWIYWWAFNKDRFLKLREKIGKVDGPITGGDSGGEDLLGGKDVRSSMHPTREQLAAEVTPVLLGLLNKESDATMLNACAISLAKIGENDGAVLEKLSKLLSHSNMTVAENAALSLGILGSTDAIQTLKSVYLDDAAGRKIAGDKSEVPWRVRTMAAYGLGLAASHTRNPHHHKNIQQTLLTPFKSGDSIRASQRDVGVASILALSMVPDLEGLAPAILENYFLSHAANEELLCAHIPGSVARIYRTLKQNDRARYAQFLLKTMPDPAASGKDEAARNLPRLARCGVAIGLGMVTDFDDPFAPAVIRTLKNAATEQLSRYPETAYLSLIALGEIAGTTDPGGDIEKFLVERVMAQSGRVTTRAWSALALGVEGYKQNERRGGAIKEKDPLAGILEERMINIKDPEQRAAMAVALGLRGAKPAAASFTKCLADVKVEDFRGFFALALGLTGAREAAPMMLDLLKENVRKPGVFQQCAIGLGLMGVKEVVPVLVDVLRDARNKSFVVQSAVADSLGYVGDYRALRAVLAVLKDENREFTNSARTFAAVALGLIGDKDMEPWNAKISTNINYFAFVETLTDLIWEQ
jgi:HEAT repeat protein